MPHLETIHEHSNLESSLGHRLCTAQQYVPCEGGSLASLAVSQTLQEAQQTEEMIVRAQLLQ